MRKILVVDDNAINRSMLANTLSRDYDILEAENGIEALAVINKYYKVISAVLLDIVMPEMDGYEVLRHMRGNAALSQLPVIMVTGSEDEASRVKALSCGANDFILKPFNPDIVRHCLRNNIAMRETASILNAIQRDKLTGLFNREAFFEKAGVMINDKEPGYYILSSFDIDNFKLINDQHGAAEGDRVLKEIGVVLRSSMDELGGLAGRISADNFAALFPASKENTGILNELRGKSLAEILNKPIVFSVGRYHITDTTLAASAIYDRAYLAKQTVKKRFDTHMAYFDEDMLQKLVRDQEIALSMESALRGNQFEVWFQPQYNHITNALTGAEALVRWRHPEKGLIAPADFIPLFEQNGFVYELDKYVWRTVCRHIAKWRDEGLSPLPVSVNVSRYDIFRADLIEVITGFLREFDVPSNMLHLEITESTFAKSTDTIVSIVKKLVNLGFIVEIDDFGSGYSSLNTLKSVPAQVVKLDMRFLEGGEDAQRGGNILESIVRMTKWLGMAVIAEGVETRAQGDFLKSIGCSRVQGYYYARPMPSGDYEDRLTNSNKEMNMPVLETVDALDSNAFWNPDSIDSLMFSSYVGAACIYEYRNGKIELIRATDKFAKSLGGESMTIDRLMRLDLNKYADRNFSGDAFKKISDSIHTREETVGEFLFIGLPNCPAEVYIRSTMRVIAGTDDRYLLYCISENITKQRISERNERRTANQLRAILANVNCGITATSVNNGKYKLLLANDKYYDLLGFTEEQYKEEVGIHVMGRICEEDREYTRAIIDNTMKTGKSATMEYRALQRNNGTIWVRSYLSIASFENTEARVLLCTFADITAEKNTAQDLLDNLPCGAGICTVSDDDARMTYLNKKYFTYFSSGASARQAASAFDAIHPDDRATLRNAIRPAITSGGEGSCVVRVKDGQNPNGTDKYLPFRISGTAMQSEGDKNSIYVTLFPVTQEELSFSEMLPVALEKVMESSSELSFIKDRQLRYICCSRAFAHMVGLKSEKDIVGKTDYDIFSTELAERYAKDDRALMETGKSIIDIIEDIPPEDGKRRISCTSKYLLSDSAGNVIGLYGTGHDITKTQEAEARQKFLINNIPGGVAVYEGTWSTLDSIRLSYFSDGFCKLFGYTREEYEKLGNVNPTGLVMPEYIPGFVSQIDALIKTGSPIDYLYRAKTKDGSLRWINVKAILGETRGETQTVNALLFDISARQEALERLRISEEENRLAIQHGHNVVCRYDIASKKLKISSSIDPIFGIEQGVYNVPDGEISDDKISEDTKAAYRDFYKSINNGEKNGSVVYQRFSERGWRWIEGHFSTIYSRDGLPVSAVLSFADVTEDFEKDIAYKKWTQSLNSMASESYSLFRCNIVSKTVYDQNEGSLLYFRFTPGPYSFDTHTEEYSDKCVFSDDRQTFREFLDSNTLLKKYQSGERILRLEYRELLPGNGMRWLRLSVDLVECSRPGDIEAYLLFEDIDREKRAALAALEQAELDSLTGLLNRAAFTEKVNEKIASSKPGALHALIMMDLDGFKLVNDTFGHAAGDRALVDMSNLLRTAFRHGDLVGRLGGDEFLVFLYDIPGERLAATKARQICDMLRKTYGADVRVSGSAGIAMFPADGMDFDSLYKKADEALYYVKDSGRDNYAFFQPDMQDVDANTENKSISAGARNTEEKKRRMLIVDGCNADNLLLYDIFRDEYIIEKAGDASAALARLRHYGSSVSVVLLDLTMPGMNSADVLDRMQQNPETAGIPVIAVCGNGDRETALAAIRGGASYFVTKPVDPELLYIRVTSAVSKAENERLKAKKTLFKLQNNEVACYRTVFERLGLAVAELGWNSSLFSYSPSMSFLLAGNYDDRPLWHILQADSVADTKTVAKLQQLTNAIGENRRAAEDRTEAQLTTPDGILHDFLVCFYRVPDLSGATDRIILTFKDLGESPKINEPKQGEKE